MTAKVKFMLKKKQADGPTHRGHFFQQKGQPTELPPNLDGNESVLLDQYYKNVRHYIRTDSKYQMSALKDEICSQVRQRALFQTKVFGKSATNFYVLPQSAFSSFSVSLHLVLKENCFYFFSSNPGFEINEPFDDEGAAILESISGGVLPPNVFEDLKKLNLVWYDGGLICEIEDQRKKYLNTVRTLLRVHPLDIASLGSDCESQFLLARYPLISFDPSIQVSRVARSVSRDTLRWKEIDEMPTPQKYVQKHFPSLFLEENHISKPSKEHSAIDDVIGKDDSIHLADEENTSNADAQKNDNTVNQPQIIDEKEKLTKELFEQLAKLAEI